MLTKSVSRVTEIVSSTKRLMDPLILHSKDRVDVGSANAHQCAVSLDEILLNVTSMSQMVREISVASQEQSVGIREVNRTMSELDQMTKDNSSVAQSSSETADELKNEADKLGGIVTELTVLVKGA
jgi:methyl-accepting chemotaxis protein